MQPAGIVDRRVDVGTARLEQQHANVPIDEPARGSGAGGAGADDDDVGFEALGVGVSRVATPGGSVTWSSDPG